MKARCSTTRHHELPPLHADPAERYVLVHSVPWPQPFPGRRRARRGISRHHPVRDSRVRLVRQAQPHSTRRQRAAQPRAVSQLWQVPHVRIKFVPG